MTFFRGVISATESVVCESSATPKCLRRDFVFEANKILVKTNGGSLFKFIGEETQKLPLSPERFFVASSDRTFHFKFETATQGKPTRQLRIWQILLPRLFLRHEIVCHASSLFIDHLHTHKDVTQSELQSPLLAYVNCRQTELQTKQQRWSI